MSEIILGVDIGATGAIAVLTVSGELVDVFDMPVLADGPAGRRKRDYSRIAKTMDGPRHA